MTKRLLGVKEELIRLWHSKVEVKGQGQAGQVASHAREHDVSTISGMSLTCMSGRNFIIVLYLCPFFGISNSICNLCREISIFLACFPLETL